MIVCGLITFWLLLATVLSSAIANVIGHQWFVGSPWLLFAPSVAFSLLLTLIGGA